MSRQQAERRGRAAEWAAMLFLLCKGYRILGHRLRTPYGEVDLAA
jgi:putative endonuclease